VGIEPTTRQLQAVSQKRWRVLGQNKLSKAVQCVSTAPITRRAGGACCEYFARLVSPREPKLWKHAVF